MEKSFIRVGTLIKNKRMGLGLSMRKVGRGLKCNNPKTGGQQISNIEKGQAGLPPKHAEQICQTLNMRKMDLFKAMMLDHKNYLDQHFPGLRYKILFYDFENGDVDGIRQGEK